MKTRRESFSDLGGSLCLALSLFNLPSSIRQNNKPAVPNEVVGTWHYRSFVNNPQKVSDVNTILFGEGDFELCESPLGQLSGTGDFGGGDTVKFQGIVSHGSLTTIRFRGIGTGSTNSDWLYDYLGVVMSSWPNGVAQIPSIVGTVVRSAPHANGSGGISPAGTVASFIALKR
jgi:hypothetical protein